LTATTTDAIGVGVGGMIAMLAWPATPSLTALMTAVPGATAEITPASVMFAIAALDENHFKVRPDRAAPFASLMIAVARAVWPATRERGTVTTTDATFTGVSLTSTTEVPYVEHAATMKTRPVTVSMKARIECALRDSVIRRLDWHGVVQGAVASWLCVAGFRRVCLCRTPLVEACDPAVQ
jgi:hypothetical protein